jgi:hypothetical protein
MLAITRDSQFPVLLATPVLTIGTWGLLRYQSTVCYERCRMTWLIRNSLPLSDFVIVRLLA